jgi:hypothetical protein
MQVRVSISARSRSLHNDVCEDSLCTPSTSLAANWRDGVGAYLLSMVSSVAVRALAGRRDVVVSGTTHFDWFAVDENRSRFNFRPPRVAGCAHLSSLSVRR